jgi:Poxvirus A32 protein
MSKKEDVDETEIKNHYKQIPKKFQEEERHYPNEKKVQIKLPFRMCLIGASGSGKTNCLIELIEQMNCFDKIILMAKNTEEPLYATLIDNIREVEKKTGAQILTVGNNITELPDLKTIDKKSNTLLIVDDMVNEKDKQLGRVAEYFTMGRKQYVSPIFISQSYFKVPKIIRENTGYFVFTKITGNRDLFMILKDFELGVTEEQLLSLYNASATGFPNFFMIDRETNDKDLIFRKNFKGIKPPNTAETKATSNIVVPGSKGKLRRAKAPPPNMSSHAPRTIVNKIPDEPKEYVEPIVYMEDIDPAVYMEDIDPAKDMDFLFEDQDENMGGKIKNKRRRISPKKISDAELRRMMRLYGFC